MFRFPKPATLTICMSIALAAVTPAWAGSDLNSIQSDWAHIKYEAPADQREAALEQLADQAHEYSQSSGKASALVWEAIVKASLAGEKGALGGAMGYVEDAKSLLEQAIDKDTATLNASAYTTLGSLYYQVPGWPIGFGDDDKARELLSKALTIDPDGIDSNFFYGDFLLDQGEYDAAIKAFEKAIAAPARAKRPIADAGRRKEAEAKIAEARKHLDSAW